MPQSAAVIVGILAQFQMLLEFSRLTKVSQCRKCDKKDRKQETKKVRLRLKQKQTAPRNLDHAGGSGAMQKHRKKQIK